MDERLRKGWLRRFKLYGPSGRGKPAATIPAIIRFEDKYIPEPNSGCWLWTAGRDRHGYGTFRESATCRSVRAHRFSWSLKNGPIPDGLGVLHRCDVPSCVNPDHLFLGTQMVNIRDMFSKGREKILRGMDANNRRLTDGQVTSIRRDPRKHDEIAADYGVSRSAVSHVKNRHSWRHIP